MEEKKKVTKKVIKAKVEKTVAPNTEVVPDKEGNPISIVKLGDNDVLIHIQRTSSITKPDSGEKGCVHIIMHTEVGKDITLPLPNVSLSRHGDGCYTPIDKFCIHDGHAPLHPDAESANAYMVRICKAAIKELSNIGLKKVNFAIYDVDASGQPNGNTIGLITPQELVAAATS
jgi:hypothetical protein